MKKILSIAIIVSGIVGCMSTSEPQGGDTNTWSDYKSWYKANPTPHTGDPTGFLGNVHEGNNAVREIHINSTGEAVNRGTSPFPYPVGTVIVKESYANQAEHAAGESPDLTIMVKLPTGSSPETADWEYVMGADGINRGTGTSGLATFCHNCHTAAAATDFSFINSTFYRNQP
ncbi:MAG: cytochrome P460 family protein [Gammaproteobacteria bacterium]|nr:cytochrome P460 family protein [Gammaproteobacteria bacterium]MDP2346434.1 cytochrome P460 family protein [Gammaproteobacteria bacterium]